MAVKKLDQLTPGQRFKSCFGLLKKSAEINSEKIWSLQNLNQVW